ncbi:MAG: hypothetical protein WDN49_15815 [Acetobacteraceae bacterium]
MVVHVALGAGQQPGTIIVESVWPNAAFEGGIGINALTSDEAAYPPERRRGLPRHGDMGAGGAASGSARSGAGGCGVVAGLRDWRGWAGRPGLCPGPAKGLGLWKPFRGRGWVEGSGL